MPGRQRHAAEVLAALAPPLSDARVLSVQCANGHHVAGVYSTAEGPVVQAVPGRHSHGHRDRIDTPHRGTPGRGHWADFLDAGAMGDDSVPAWCDCGPWTLSRTQMAAWMADGERRVVLESRR
jgi:hypothetical protein